MAVQTLAQFKSATRLQAKGLRIGKLRDIRSKSIKPIDHALAAFDQVRNRYDLGIKSEKLQALLGQCAAWLKSKQVKVSSNSALRRNAILTLAQQTFDELKTMQRARGVDFYNLNKSITTGNRVNYQKKGLSAGYSNERQMYLNNNKVAHPVAAGFVHSGMDNLPLTGFGRNFGQQDRAQVALDKSFSALTPYDFELIANAYADSMNTGNPEVVHFSNKEERSGKLMVVYPGYNQDFEDISGQSFDTTMIGGMDPHAGYMYAMDEYGTLFASEPQGLSKNGAYWNHSSFNAGKDVICAGIIKIQNGALRYIDNASGHYKPDRQNLFELLSIFQAEGINLVGVNIGILEPSHLPKILHLHSLTALNFLANANLMDPNPQQIPG
jgi:hypothetical protein